MKALIIGGGIGGPVAGAAMHRAGIEPVVYEAHTSPGDSIGLFLTLSPNGLSALETLGMLAPVRAAAAMPTTSLEMVNSTGRLLGTVSDAEQPPNLSSVTINRGALQRALAEAAADQGVAIEYGKRLTGCTESEGKVVASFADGTQAQGDVLIGADGLHSPVRNAIDPHAPDPGYLGLLNFGGYARAADIPHTPEATMRMVFGRRAFFGYQVSSTGEVYWFANLGHRELSASELQESTEQHWRNRLLDLFSGDIPDIDRILRASDAGFQPFNAYDIGSLPHWHRSRITVMGDAAHPVASSSGQGAAMAMEDGVTLATVLRDIGEPQRALATYAELRRGRVEKIVAQGRRTSQSKAVANPVGVLVRDTVMRGVLWAVAKRKSRSWIHDHRIDFDTPVREAPTLR